MLNAPGENERIAMVKLREQEIAALGRVGYRPPGLILNLGLPAMRTRERNDAARVIDALM